MTKIHSGSSIRQALGTKVIGERCYLYDTVTSTNDLAHRFAHEDAPEGTIVFAKGQTQGRGRLGRSWVSPAGTGLYFSFVVRPDITPADAPRITLATALAVVQALGEARAGNALIKWPNDILLGDKKVCGILTEMSFSENKIDYIVVGVGVNVNSQRRELPASANSLREATGRLFDIDDLSHIIMKRIDLAYSDLQQGKFSQIIARVREHSAVVLGSRVRVVCGDRTIEGYASDFDEHGALVIRRDNGLAQSVTAGHLERIQL